MTKEKENTSSDVELAQLTERKLEERIKDFSELLKNIENLDDKKRVLWTEIYENAISDRQNSYVMFTKLFMLLGDKSTEWAVHGKNVAVFIERMAKANDQLIKLAELVAAAERKTSANIDPEEMFERIRDK